MTELYSQAFKNLADLHQRVKGLLAALASCYPVALVEAQQLMIYDFDPGFGGYRFVKQAPLPMPIPKGVRSAFQLEDYGGRIACVVAPEIFDSQDGFVTILHEFVHCYQYETCEQDLKQALDIAQKAREVGDCMWEINYPFPYEARNFIEEYTCFLHAAEEGDSFRIYQARRALQSYLGVHDFEYMVWQEWKEGFARWVENCVKRFLEIPENKAGASQPFSRLLFYFGGESFISFLAQQDKALLDDLPGLFRQMFRFDPNNNE